MTGSALRWAALNMKFAGQPGARRSALAGAVACAVRSGGPEALSGLLPPGWEADAREEMERARRFGAGVLTLEDAGYPALLRVSSDPPPLLYVWGRLLPEDALAIAVVGSRRATPHGTHLASRIAEGLAGEGFAVVSGLARGIDAAAHRGALKGGGRTLAILGSGLDRIYPAEHRALAEAIAARGAVLTELPFGSAPLKRNFPERNRLIAWISWATVVVEAAKGSGSLITAALAADEGRAVYAVPGPVGAPNAEGTNGLLRDGALVCRSATDVTGDLAPQVSEAARLLAGRRLGAAPGAPGAETAEGMAATPGGAPLTPEQRRVLDALPPGGGIGIESLGAACGLPPGSLLATLLELEILGRVRQLPGRRFMGLACKI